MPKDLLEHMQSDPGVSHPYLLAAAVLRALNEGSGPGWLHLLVLLCIWSSMKLTIMGPVSVFLLLRARAREHVERRRAIDVEQRTPVREEVV